MKISKAIISCITLVCVFTLNSSANDERNEVRTPGFTIQVPKDHLFLVAVDRGEPGNRIFIDRPEGQQSQGVDPVAGRMMRLPAEVSVSLASPEKRENPKLTTLWKIYAGYKYTERESEPIGDGGELKSTVDWDWIIGYTFEVARDKDRNVIETPVTPKLTEVETGIEGTKLYQIPFAEVDGVTRYIVVLVSDSFDSASKVLRISNENPKFEWNTSWFLEQPTQQ